MGFVLFFIAVGLCSQLSAWPKKVYLPYFLVAFNATVSVGELCSADWGK